jgi:TolA-binding protein
MSKPHQEPQTLASYLQPSVTPTRLERNRLAIQSRLRPTAPFAGFWLLAGAACAAALVLVTWGPFSRLTGFEEEPTLAWQPDEGMVLESQQEVLVAVLQDGTRLDLESRTSLAGTAAVAGKVELELRRGHASFDVTHNPARQFRVRAGSVTVVVLGTRFSVTRRDGKVTVAVQRGKVAVENGTDVAYLTPGQSWEGAERGGPRAAAVSGESLASPGAPLVDSANRESADASKTGVTAPEVTAPEVAAPVTAPDLSASEFAASRPNPAIAKPNGSGVTAAGVEASNRAKELFDASREARRVGDSRRAAQLLQQLVAQYPADTRAGLAAFELARIRADVLGDLGGAITALEQALRLSPQGSFRQDALARLAQAYERSGRTQACKATRQRYLDAYGEGVHAQRVLKLCP